MTDPFTRAADGKEALPADPVAQRIVERGRAERARRDEAKAPRKDAGVLVIGLGRFGTAIAATLDRLGQDVLAVERDPELVAQWSGQLPLVEADASNPVALEQLGARDFPVAVVGVGTSLEALSLIHI